MSRAEWFERYRAGPEKLRRALSGLTAADVNARPGPGAWSIREVVCHLQDSEAVYIDRMKRVVAEDNPALMAFDENRFVERLRYDRQSLDDALTLIDAGRRQWARVLESLPEDAFQRTGVHSVAGSVTLDNLFQGAVEHFEHHLAFLIGKRQRLGKPLP